MGGWNLQPAYREYLKEDKVQNLRLYKYAAIDKSPISKYILKPYWDFAITLFPKWIAPNLITLIGLFFMIANVIIICIWSPLLDTNAPNWINFSFAAGLWLYSTFDNVDGRQARRTGTSSPLGELFDHGCDAVNCTYVTLLQCAAFGLGHSPLSAALLFVTIVGFYLSTAEEYYTGVLYLGYVNGPTEGIILTCVAFIWSGIYGVTSWHVPLDEISSLAFLTKILPSCSSTTFADLFVWGMVGFFFVTHLPVVIYSIANVCDEKGFSKCRVFGHVFGPILVTGIMIIIWIDSPSCVIFSQQHFILFTIYAGFLFGQMASDIILAHLTKSEYPRFNNTYWSLFLLVFFVKLQDSFRIYILQDYVLLGLCTSEFIDYMVRAVYVIRTFCDFLGIRCFAIPYHDESLTYKKKHILPVTNVEVESLLVGNTSATSTYNSIN